MQCSTGCPIATAKRFLSLNCKHTVFFLRSLDDVCVTHRSNLEIPVCVVVDVRSVGSFSSLRLDQPKRVLNRT